MARILIIDDDQHVTLSLKMGLESVPHEVATAANGHEGLAAAREHAFDLVITDIIMPEMEGLETISELRKLHPGTEINAISGGGRINPEEYLDMAKALGASRVFAKPVDIQALRDAIDELVVSEGD